MFALFVQQFSVFMLAGYSAFETGYPVQPYKYIIIYEKFQTIVFVIKTVVTQVGLFS